VFKNYFWLHKFLWFLFKGKQLFFWLGNGITITEITWTSLFGCVYIKVGLSWKYTLAWLTLVLTNVYLVVVPQQRCLELECFTTCYTVKSFTLAFFCIHNQRLFTIEWLTIHKIWSSVRYFWTYLKKQFFHLG